MRKLISLFFTFFIFSNSNAQNIELELKNIPIEIKNNNFYILNVIDSRTDTSRIGWSIINKETRGKYYTLKNGTTRALTSYLKNNLKSDSTAIPLVLNIISMYVKEKGKLMKGADAYVMVQFLREKNGSYGKVFETKAYTESVSEVGKDIYTSHERRIRIVIIECLKKLNESAWLNTRPDFVSEIEIKQEAMLSDTLSKKIADTTGLFSNAKKEVEIALQLRQIQYKSGFIPAFSLENKKYHHLWAFKRHFKQSDDIQTQKLFTDYKAKFRLTFFALGLGAAIAGLSFASAESEGPNLALLIPGAVFSLCSIPIYIKCNKLARRTVERYNTVILDK